MTVLLNTICKEKKNIENYIVIMLVYIRGIIASLITGEGPWWGWGEGLFLKNIPLQVATIFERMQISDIWPLVVKSC